MHTRRIGRLLLWLLLCVPATMMIVRLTGSEALAMDLLHPSGEMPVRLMVLAMLPGPLSEVLGSNRFLRGWMAIRRHLGIAAFGYALLHLAFYIVDMRQLAAMIEELALPGIWTGWLALGLLIPPAAISFDRAMRNLGRRWKQIQTVVYAALLAALVHWLLLDWNWQPAVVHLAPLIVAWSLRGIHRYRRLATERSLA